MPMLATLLSAMIGGLLGGLREWEFVFLLYLVAVFAALYCGHIVDSLIDYHYRGETKYVYMGFFEDSGGLLSRKELVVAGLLASVVFFVALLSITSIGTALFWTAFSAWIIAISYSPLLDRNPLTVSSAYPLGTTLAMVGGYLLVGARHFTVLLALAISVMLYLLGGKVISDLIDYDDDKRTGKQTVVVALGPKRGRRLGYLISALGLIIASFGSYTRLLPSPSLLGVVAAAGILVKSYSMNNPRSILVLVCGGYLFLAVLIVSLL